MVDRRSRTRFTPEFRERAGRLVLEQAGEHPSRWAAWGAISGKIGCAAGTLRSWVGTVEQGGKGRDAGTPAALAERLQALERENRELRPLHKVLGQ